DQVVPLGGSALISLGDVSGEVQDLQWNHFNMNGKWVAIPDVTSGTLQLDSLSEDDAGLYMARFELNGETWLSTPSELMILLAQPQNITAFEGSSGTMSLDILSMIPGKLQWQKFTTANQWEDILQGSGPSLELNYVTGYDAGAYRVRLSDSWFSDEAILTVETETTPPEITRVEMNTDRYIRVIYSEYVSTETALNTANYQLDGGAQILNAVASGSSSIPGAVLVVLLETTPLAQGSVYALSVSGVCDISFNKNPIAPGTVKYIQTDIMGQGLLREVWYNCNSSLSTLTSKATYPNSPDLVDSVASFASPIDWGDNYGQKLSGLIIPPFTGSYTFWICSDDDSELWLSTDESPTHKRRIAYLYGWAPVDNWENYASQKSSPVSLTANKPYYIEGIQTDGTGGDHIIVRWQLPSGAMESPIPQTRLYPPGASFTAPEIVVQPQSLSCYEGESAAFEVFVKSGTPITYRWEVNGVPDNSLNQRILSFDNVTPAQNGLQVRCRVTNLNGEATSAAATLSVLAPLEEVSILTQPQGGTIREGDTLTLSVQAAGSPPLSYAWYWDGIRVEGDAETLVVSEAGFYKVKVTNPKGSLFSNEVQVIVQSDPQEPPTITILRGTSDQVLVQFEGRLEASSSLSEPDWVQIATESPAWITPSEKMRFFRAVR
ncbi:MAG TPA: PA14 domain-containing protein, partial [Verrucomicrobiota bacterium]|nr:PA14 domain-containing protein [Verrucomicrobiota bacterium]